jgi:hypothetical protein
VFPSRYHIGEVELLLSVRWSLHIDCCGSTLSILRRGFGMNMEGVTGANASAANQQFRGNAIPRLASVNWTVLLH